MPIRITGLNSGLDTDSIVQELVSAYSLKKQNYEKAKTKLEWKKDAWKELNTKIYKLYSGTLSSLRFSTAYNKKTTASSDTSKAQVTASNTAVNGVQSLQIKELAATGYLTGGKLTTTTGDKATAATTLSSLGYTGGDANITLTVGGKSTDISINGDTKISELVNELKNAGVAANFDETNQRIFVSAKDSGLANDFSLNGADADGIKALNALGLNVKSNAGTEQYKALAAYAQYDADGNYDAAATKDYIQLVLEQVEERKANIESLKADNNALQDKNTNLAALKEYAERVHTVSDTLAKTSLTQDEQEALKGYLVMTDEELAADPDAAAELERLKNASGMSDEEWSTLKKNVNANHTYEKEAETAGTASDVQAVQAAVAGGEDTYNAYIAGIDANVESNNNQIADNLAAIKIYEKENDAHNAVTTESGTIAEQTAAVAAKVKNAVDVLAGKYDDQYNNGATKINAKDAVIILNDAEFTSASNTMTVNGITITALQKTAENESVSITTATDVQGLYDTIRNFIKEYNSIINEMDSLYNAASAKGYEPLTDDEKEEMSESEIEKWEEKIKDSLLRRDDTLSTVMSSMTTAMSKSYTVNGKSYSLSSFGIKTAGYFLAADNEGNAYHIDGDSEDSVSSGNKDRLMTMIQEDPDSVQEFFTQLTNGLYESLGSRMKGSELRSMYTVYNDKQMDKEIKNYQELIDKWDDKLEYYEDYYYNKFSAMETALAKMQSATSSLSSLLGG